MMTLFFPVVFWALCLSGFKKNILSLKNVFHAFVVGFRAIYGFKRLDFQRKDTQHFLEMNPHKGDSGTVTARIISHS